MTGPLDPSPIPQGPHQTTDADAIDGPDWTMADSMPAPAGSVVMARARLIYAAEQAAQAEARDAWSERQRIEADDRRRRGVERMHRGLEELRDRRDQQDEERTHR
jgi:hypothetical protein